MLKNCFLFFFLIIFSRLSFGQNLQKMQIWQDSLYRLGQKVFSNVSEVERMESNFLFVKTLVSSLKEPNSYYFNFDKLNMISVLKSHDDRFRIFSWNVPLQDGSYLYYGSIQFKGSDLKLIPLLDKTFEIKEVNRAELTSTTWFGAQYYEVIPFNSSQYLLLGWKGHDGLRSKKIIDVLNIFSDRSVTFGAKLFDDDAHISRKIFTYAKQASMYLKYNKALKQIEFDHLIPLEGGAKDQNVPDLTHDAYKLTESGLQLLEDIEVLNKEDTNPE